MMIIVKFNKCVRNLHTSLTTNHAYECIRYLKVHVSHVFYIHIEQCYLFKLHSAKLVPQWIVSKSLNIPEFPLMMCRWLYKTLKRGTCRHNIFVQENNNSIFCVWTITTTKTIKKKLSSKTDVESKWKTMLNICFQIIINLSFVSF